MKRINVCFIMFLSAFLACNSPDIPANIIVEDISIVPSTGDADSITAYVRVSGSGELKLQWYRHWDSPWENWGYPWDKADIDTCVKITYQVIETNTITTIEMPLVVTDKAGWYRATVLDVDAQELLAVSDSVWCSVPKPQISDFTVDENSGPNGPAPWQVTFFFYYSNCTMWKIDFGDGNTEIGQKYDEGTSYVYEEPGDYTVTLFAVSDAGVDTLTKINYIHVLLP